jgi:hypothetical protein
MINLPNKDTKTWKQANDSDVFGNISTTKNITFDSNGYLRLSHSNRALMNETTDTDFDEPMVILRSQDYGYFMETSDSAFEIDASKFFSVRPTQIATAGVPTGDLQSDATFVGGLMVVTQDTDVDYYDPAANTWTDTNISLTNTAQGQHPIEKFVSLASFAVADINTVKLYATPITATPTLSVTLTILADFYITSLAYFNQNLYIGTMNRFGGHAFMYVWNGYGTAAQSAYEVDSNIIYDVCVHQDSIVCVTGTGQLLRFNGSGFDTLDSLPIFFSDRAMSDETNINMYHNCLKSNGDLLYINVNDKDNNTVLTNQPQGLWCYDSTLGFMYHRYSHSNALVLIDTIANTDANTTTNQITVASAPITGTEVLYDSLGNTGITPLITGTRYYAIKIDSTHIQLATTKALALASTPIDLTAQSDSNSRLTSFPNVDWGQYMTGRTAAVCVVERIIDDAKYGTDVLFGGDVYGRTNSSQGTLTAVTSAVESRGYFITPKVFSQEVDDTFNQITLKFAPFLSDIDKIIIKYRVIDDRRDSIYVGSASVDWAATWTSSTTFTTTEPAFATAVAGNEVEVLRGAAAGLIAHISTISVNAGTYTVTLDDTFEQYTAGDKSTVVFRNWIKWRTITAGDTHAQAGFMSNVLGVQGKFIQLKVELRGVGVKIEELSIDNKYHLPSKK